MGVDAFDSIISELSAERKRLDDLLDDALEQFALYEEAMNGRMKIADAEQLAVLMAQRCRMEESLGIANLVDRIDQLRERIAVLKG